MIAQMNAAAGSLGIVLLPSFATKGRPELIPVLPGLAATTREVWLNVHSDLQFAPRIRAVRAFLKSTLKQDPDMQVTLGAVPAHVVPQP
jgi:DNA-binding transcriptional LysR family regulator